MTRTTPRARLALVLCGALAVSSVLLPGAASLHARGQSPDPVKQLLTTNKCRGCDLQHAQLVDKNLTGADLTGANLSGAFMYKAILRAANLKNATLTGADLKGADLSGARDADLSGAFTNQYTKCPSGKPGPCIG
jgi:uncharacterized protein YjbI with pentapeptide repeats